MPYNRMVERVMEMDIYEIELTRLAEEIQGSRLDPPLYNLEDVVSRKIIRAYALWRGD